MCCILGLILRPSSSQWAASVRGAASGRARLRTGAGALAACCLGGMFDIALEVASGGGLLGYRLARLLDRGLGGLLHLAPLTQRRVLGGLPGPLGALAEHVVLARCAWQRSEERRVGKECVTTFKSRGWP